MSPARRARARTRRRRPRRARPARRSPPKAEHVSSPGGSVVPGEPEGGTSRSGTATGSEGAECLRANARLSRDGAGHPFGSRKGRSEVAVGARVKRLGRRTDAGSTLAPALPRLPRCGSTGHTDTSCSTLALRARSTSRRQPAPRTVAGPPAIARACKGQSRWRPQSGPRPDCVRHWLSPKAAMIRLGAVALQAAGCNCRSTSPLVITPISANRGDSR